MNAQLRTAFEAWMLTGAKCVVGSTDPYPAGLERDYWRAWQACAAALAAPKEAGDWADVNTVIQHGTCHELASQDELHRYVEARDRLLNRLATPSPQDRATGEGEIAHIAYDFLLAAGYDMDSAPLTKIKEAALSSPTGEGAVEGGPGSLLAANVKSALGKHYDPEAGIVCSVAFLAAAPHAAAPFGPTHTVRLGVGYGDAATPQRAPGVDWQQRCIDLGFKYWRAPDAHGVECTPEQALSLLRELLGVEVDFGKVAAPVSTVGVDGVRRLIGLWRAVDEGDGFDGPDYERGRFETLLNCADELEAALTSGPSGVES